MHELYVMQPTASLVETTSMRGEGVTGVYSGNRVIRMFPGALIALLEVHDGVHEGLMVAVASSADTPR
jgi:magnesium-dependent phosphatase 1